MALVLSIYRPFPCHQSLNNTVKYLLRQYCPRYCWSSRDGSKYGEGCASVISKYYAILSKRLEQSQIMVSTGSVGRDVLEPLPEDTERGMALLRKGARMAEQGLVLYMCVKCNESINLLLLCFRDSHVCFPSTFAHCLWHHSKGPALHSTRNHSSPDWSQRLKKQRL